MRNTSPRARLPRWLVAAALLGAGPALAERPARSPDPGPEGGIVETMIVTAHRVPVASTRVGSAVSTVSATELERRQAIFASDVLRDVPGVALSRNAGYGSLTQLRIRGAEANQVLVLIDGVEANDPALGDEFDFASLMSYDVDRIEVLRGPQSALWGSDATAGVINIRTDQGGDGFEAGAFVEHGSAGTYHGGAKASWNDDRGGVSLRGAYYDTDGDSAAAAGSEDDGYENAQLSLSARYEPTEASSLRFFTRYADTTSEFDGIDFSTGVPADADNESDNELLLTGLSGSLALLEGRWNHDLRLTYLDSDNEQSSGGIDAGSTAAEKIGVYYQSTYALPDWGTLREQQLIVALDYEEEDFEQRGEAFAGFDPNQDQSLDNRGYVAEYLVAPLPGLDLSASVRYDDASDFDNVATYRFTASYLLAATGTRLHGSAGKSQKSPTFIERFGFFPDQFLGNESLRPEENRGFDLGVQQHFLGGRLSADVTYFRERLEDEINGFAFDADSGLFTAENLDGRSRRDGVELSLDGQLSQALTLGFTYSYTDSRQPDAGGGRSRELRRPKHMASANANYAFLGGRASFNVNWSYTSEQRDRFFPPFPATPETVKLDDYHLVTVAGSFRLSRALTLYGRVENLGDERYENVFGFRGPKRAYTAGLRMNL